MTATIRCFSMPWVMTMSEFPAGRGVASPLPQEILVRSRLATDSIGTTTLTLTNIVVGSVIRLEVATTGALVELRTADTTTEVFTPALYPAGSASNDLRIKVRKGSASTFYKPYETLATLTASAQSVYIAQIPD